MKCCRQVDITLVRTSCGWAGGRPAVGDSPEASHPLCSHNTARSSLYNGGRLPRFGGTVRPQNHRTGGSPSRRHIADWADLFISVFAVVHFNVNIFINAGSLGTVGAGGAASSAAGSGTAWVPPGQTSPTPRLGLVRATRVLSYGVAIWEEVVGHVELGLSQAVTLSHLDQLPVTSAVVT